MSNKALYLLVPVALGIGIGMGVRINQSSESKQLTPRQKEIVADLEHITKIGSKLLNENSCRFADDNDQYVEKKLATFYSKENTLPRFLLGIANQNYELKLKIEKKCIEPIRSKMDAETYDQNRGDWLYFQDEILNNNCADAMVEIGNLKAKYQKDGWAGKAISDLLKIEKETKNNCFADNSRKPL